MRRLFLLIVLLMTQPCLADEPKWYALNRENGCQSMTEVHESWPFLSGYWTPTALFNVLNSKYHDAKLTPSEVPKDAGDVYNKFTKSNALVISSRAGMVELPLMTADLCKEMGVLPVEPEQWLSEPSKTQAPETEQAFVSPTSWYQVSVTMLKHATEKLKENSFIELHEEMGQFYAGPHYAAENNKRSYLVRGLFASNMGQHMLFFKDGVLFVVYQTIGGIGDEKPLPHFSPLVVNLPAKLKSIVVQIKHL